MITGANGFIAKNLRAQLAQNDTVKVLLFDRKSSPQELEESVNEADFIFHLAGVNRPKNVEEFAAGNFELTETIIKLLQKHKNSTPLLVASSTQASQDNPYGHSKKSAEDVVFAWSKESQAKVCVYRLPGVFGKWAKPNYNSVVATFSHNIANNLDITISDPAHEVTLVYVDDVVASFISALDGEVTVGSDGFCHIERSFQITLQDLSNKLHAFKTSRESGEMPAFESIFDRFLYATFTSYFAKRDFDYQLEMKHDDRGWLAEFIKSEPFGQIFISRTKPGIARGNHWHHTKIEKFLVIDGEAEIAFRKFDTDEILTYNVNGEKLTVVDIPAGYIHSITNTGGEDLLTIFWANEIFNSELPDTYYEEVR